MSVPRRTILLAGLALALAVAAVVLRSPPELWQEGADFLLDLWSRLEAHPVLLYFLMVVLPAFMVPQSPFLVLAGIVYAEPFGETGGAALAASAVALNILWTYFLTVGPLHRVVSRFLARFGYRIPALPPADLLKFSFLVRVTPVLPLCVQNYTLGLMRVPLAHYLLASWTTQVPIAFAIALTAGAVLEGNLVAILFAAAVLLFLLLGLKWLRRRLRRDRAMAEVSDELAAETARGSGGEGSG